MHRLATKRTGKKRVEENVSVLETQTTTRALVYCALLESLRKSTSQICSSRLNGLFGCVHKTLTHKLVPKPV